jgi:hypothetical protein
VVHCPLRPVSLAVVLGRGSRIIYEGYYGRSSGLLGLLELLGLLWLGF